MFFKSAAKRTSTAAAAAPASAPAAAPSGPLTVEALGQQLREVLPTRRLQSVSLCDHEANVLWLSEGALGPDEHSLVVEALTLLTADTSLPCHEMGLEDGRLALFLPVRSPSGAPVGIAMILADRKSVGDDTLERMMAAPVRAIMQRLAVLLRPADLRSGGTARVPVLQLDEEAELAEAVDALMPPAARAPVAPAPTPVTVAAAAPPQAISAEEIDDILQFDPPPRGAAARATPGNTRHGPPQARPPRARCSRTRGHARRAGRIDRHGGAGFRAAAAQRAGRPRAGAPRTGRVRPVPRCSACTLSRSPGGARQRPPACRSAAASRRGAERGEPDYG